MLRLSKHGSIRLGQMCILNKKGTTWRKLTEAEQDSALASEQGLIDALTTHHSLIKRPVIATPDGFIVGFNEDAIRALKA